MSELESFHELAPEETELKGEWYEAEQGIGADPVEHRIRWLIAHRLEGLGTAEGGWDWLFRDPRDGRYWELTFPTGSIHGSGPRRLAVIPVARASEKYGLPMQGRAAR
jgi:hypothetical protein